jgi:hypothetical protein
MLSGLIARRSRLEATLTASLCYSDLFGEHKNRPTVTELSHYGGKKGAKQGKLREEENRAKLRLAKGFG